MDGDSSSRAITNDQARAGDGQAEVGIAVVNDRSRLGGRHQHTLHDHYNKPLRRHVWTSKTSWTREKLDREREEYFDTRVTGRTETWHAIRMAIETMPTDLSTAQTIIDAAGVTIPTGRPTVPCSGLARTDARQAT